MNNTIKHESICPYCNAELDSHTLAGNHDHDEAITISPNDLSICFACGELLTYDNDLKLQKVSEETMNEIQRDYPNEYHSFLTVQKAVRIVIEKKKNKTL